MVSISGFTIQSSGLGFGVLGVGYPLLYTVTMNPQPTYPEPYSIPWTLHPTPWTLHPTPWILHPTPYTQHPEPYTLHPEPYTQHPEPYTLHLTPYTLNLTPNTLNLTPNTLHLTPYTLNLTPNTLDLTPYTLHPVSVTKLTRLQPTAWSRTQIPKVSTLSHKPKLCTPDIVPQLLHPGLCTGIHDPCPSEPFHAVVICGGYTQAYEAVVAAASDVVVAQLFGHQHSGSFRLLRSSTSTPKHEPWNMCP